MTPSRHMVYILDSMSILVWTCRQASANWLFIPLRKAWRAGILGNSVFIYWRPPVKGYGNSCFPTMPAYLSRVEDGTMEACVSTSNTSRRTRNQNKICRHVSWRNVWWRPSRRKHGPASLHLHFGRNKNKIRIGFTAVTWLAISWARFPNSNWSSGGVVRASNRRDIYLYYFIICFF